VKEAAPDPLPTPADAGAMAQGAGAGQPIQRKHNETSPILYVVAVIIFLALCVGLTALAPILEHLAKKERAPAKNIPMLQMVR
jgi:hypothetical protein